jgi:hypothetical protein
MYAGVVQLGEEEQMNKHTQLSNNIQKWQHLVPEFKN